MKTPEQIENERLAPAGVPAGATHVCRSCKVYFIERAPGVFHRAHICMNSDLVPIAEAGPAPTTAAPAELPNRREFHVSTPAEFAAAAQVAQGGDAIIVPAEWPRESAPAEQLSGKVVCAVSRVPHVKNKHVSWLACVDPHPAEQPGKVADPRPAQPQRCQAVTRNGHRCGKEPHEEGDDEHEADNAAEGGSTLVWTEHYPHAEAPLDALREALGDATVYALRVGKALRDLIDVVSSDGDEPRRMRHAVSKAVTEGRAALSAPPPPPRELLGKEGGEALRLLHSAVEVVRFYSRPRPGSDGSLAKAWIDAHPTLPAPSSPEEQLSEVTK